MRPFTGDPNDTELARLLEYLLLIRDEPNFRRIEKRAWRLQLNCYRARYVMTNRAGYLMAS